MMLLCANCDRAATIRLCITPQRTRLDSPAMPSTLLLCTACEDAFQWGISHGLDHIEEDSLEVDESNDQDVNEQHPLHMSEEEDPA